MTHPLECGGQNIKICYTEIATLIAIEYPGKIVDAQKALKTLGGLKSVSKVHKSGDSRLQLRFRPDDIYCKSAYGTRYPTSSVLLRVKQKRHKKTGATKLCVELVGVIGTTYKFDTMMDFQYLTMERCEGEYRSLHSITTITSLEPTSWMDKQAPLHFMPQIFSPLDIPYSYHFKEEDNKKTEEDKLGIMFATARKKRSSLNQIVPYEGEVPTHPCAGATDKIKTAYLKNKLEDLRKLFEKRPIWTKAAVSAVTRLNNNRLKIILPCVAYNAVSGPWRTMWIRFGYDPKKHVEAKHLQLVDYRYRARDKLDMEKNIVLHKRSYSKYLPSVTKAKPKFAKSDQIEHLNKGDTNMEEEELTEEERNMQYMFWPGVIPPYRQLFYQICDLKLPEVQDIVNANNFKEPACTKAHGFLLPDDADKIRAAINKYVLKAVKEKCGEMEIGGKPVDDKSDEEKLDTDGYESEECVDDDALETYR